jgi:hypothetical protein
MNQSQLEVGGFKLEVQRRPEGSTINRHAREGVEHGKRNVPQVRRTGSLLTVITPVAPSALCLTKPMSTPSRARLLTVGPSGLCVALLT